MASFPETNGTLAATQQTGIAEPTSVAPAVGVCTEVFAIFSKNSFTISSVMKQMGKLTKSTHPKVGSFMLPLIIDLR